MNKPKTFIMPKKEKEEIPVQSSFNWSGLFRSAFLTFFIILIVLYGALQAKQVFDRIHANWQELRFAYEKPEFVRVVREDYEKKQSDLDQSFKQREKTAEQKLLDAVADKVQETPVKK